MQTNPAVILVHHPTGDADRPISIASMGIFSIADVLDQDGIGVSIVHLGLETLGGASFDLAEHISDSGARIVAFSVQWFFQLPDSLAAAREIKQALPDVLVVMGGFSASFFARDILDGHPGVDVVVRGEGEVPFLSLCRAVLGNSSRSEDLGIREIPNLVYRAEDGQISATAFTHRASKAEFAELRFANLRLMRNHKKYPLLCRFPTRRFQDRFSDPGGVFPLEIGRGCPHRCTFCGGNAEAQRIINNRPGPVFRPIESVLATMKEAMGYGYRTFYVCFDPFPNGDYYLRLFERIRREKLGLRFIFGCWGLPDRPFIDSVRETFVEGLFEISPETSDEKLRERNKGALSYSNAALEESVDYLATRDLVCQLFFGYFLPGDTPETVLGTQRLVHHYNRQPGCEALYLAFSTDPASLLHLHPQEHDIELGVHDLSDYLEALSARRMSSNLLAHRPCSISADQAEHLVCQLNVDQLVSRIFPGSLQVLRTLCEDPERLEQSLETFCSTFARGLTEGGGELKATPLIDSFRRLAQVQVEKDAQALSALISDIVQYESWPYVLLERHFSRLGLSYTSYCVEVSLNDEALVQFANQEDVVVVTREYQWKVPEILANIAGPALTGVRRVPSLIALAIHPSGKYATFNPVDHPAISRRDHVAE
jgi:radical SAM superfamily enzyme YgiQ (UPF0313 family)